MKKQVISIMLATTMLAGLLLSGCSGPEGSTSTPGGTDQSEPSGETVVLKLGHSLSETLVAHQAMQEFADKVAERTNGAVKIDVYPDISFILAHCGLGPEGYKASVRLAKQYDNVYLDTTGFRFSNTWTVDAIARQVGPHKVVFGTDMPFNDIGSAAGRVLLSELPLEWRIQMMGENARRVMKEI